MIFLKEIINDIPSIKVEGGKLFGARAQRVSTAEMNSIYNELKGLLAGKFNRFELSKALPTKADHGDVDIVVTSSGPVSDDLKQTLGNSVVDYHRNGNIYSILYKSSIGKTVHVDFIVAPEDEFDAQFDYLSYNDFSGILGIVARKLNFNYGSKGFFKIYIDSTNRYHYILITKNLREGLVIMGYKAVLPNFDQIQTIQDIANFIGASDLFDGKYLESFGMNAGDRKRSRSERPTAQSVRNELLALNKHRRIEDDDYFLKKEFPHYYQKLLKDIEEINTKVVSKSKYGGEWILANFPEVKPGPIIGQIKSFWQKIYGDKLDSVSEDELRAKTTEFLRQAK